MNVFARAISAIGGLAAVLGAVATAAMALHVSAEVLSRLFLGKSIFGTIEIISYFYMVAVSFLPLGEVQMTHKMIATDVIADIIPSPVRAYTDFLGRLIAIATVGLLLWAATENAIAKTRISEAVSGLGANIVVWPSRWSLVVGLFALLLAQLTQLFPLRQPHPNSEVGEMTE